MSLGPITAVTNNAITPHFLLQGCPRCEAWYGNNPGGYGLCSLCGGSRVLRVNQFTGAVTAVEIPAAE